LIELIGHTPYVGWEVAYFLDQPNYAGETLCLIDWRYNYEKPTGQPVDFLQKHPEWAINLARGIFTVDYW
jgi:hypothetical protein